MLHGLSSRAKDEVALTQDLASIEGMMQILLAGSTITPARIEGPLVNNSIKSAPTWHPSETAQKTFVVNVS